MFGRRHSELEKRYSGSGMRNSGHATSPLQQGWNVVIQHNSGLKEDSVRRRAQRSVGVKESRLTCWSFGGTGMEAQSLAEMTLNERVYGDGL